MTAQMHEWLIYNGERMTMACSPPLPDAHPRIAKTGLESISPGVKLVTTCWRGYQGTWEIKAEHLYLVGLRGRYALLGDEPLFADWFTGILKIPIGPLLQYVHSDFASLYEQELHLTIVQGLLTESKTIDNRSPEMKTRDQEVHSVEHPSIAPPNFLPDEKHLSPFPAGVSGSPTPIPGDYSAQRAQRPHWWKTRLATIAVISVIVWAYVRWRGYSEVRREETDTRRLAQEAEILRKALTGSWTETGRIMYASMTLHTNALLEINTNGTYRETVEITDADKAVRGNLLWTFEGTWSLDGLQLTLKPESAVGTAPRLLAAYKYNALIAENSLILIGGDNDPSDTSSHMYKRVRQ